MPVNSHIEFICRCLSVNKPVVTLSYMLLKNLYTSIMSPLTRRNFSVGIVFVFQMFDGDNNFVLHFF